MFLAETNSHIEHLIEACKKGSAQAQLEIYNRYCKAMYNTAHRIVKSDFEAEDIMQEAFLTAFTKLNSLNEPVLFGAWLKKIVINSSIVRYKAKMKKKEVPFDHVMYGVESDQAESESDDFTNLKAKKVLETMKELKDNYRLALTLHLIEGYDYEEISTIMGISNGSCRTVISRAKERLRKKLHGQIV